jgi:chromosomal replication initiation ATPase DnaA
VADFFKLKKEDLKSTSRARHLIMPRNIAVKLCGEYTNLNDEVMYLFNRDRTTSYNSNRRFVADYETQRAYKTCYSNLLTICDRKSYTLYREFKEQAKKEIKWIVNT